MRVKTLCLASNVMVCCLLDEDCGYVDVSDLPSTAKVGAKVDDWEWSTNFAINVLYMSLDFELWRWVYRGCKDPRATGKCGNEAMM
jgi:hypothetical protein